ncbi:STAS-like domain-containing protein [Neptunomonas phycophila]|uniref:STAS-like domain-containing protein n=1 Tax=Neptunomonas phycophila TaxID=1572645 RepID=UPI0026E283FA|nr:STAS-like domain-containing protein [Neptunomonas phycophila]MDO6467836.1 STAS-like domain-containing protein [Neptunomonas phycophila]
MKIDIAINFSPKPFGRDSNDGQFSGERFRNEQLIPAFKASDEEIQVYLDGVERGYGSSFLDEAFAGLLRNGVTYEAVKSRLKIITEDNGYFDEIWEYIEDQHKRNS